MKTGSLRARVIVVTLSLLVVVLMGVVSGVALAYRSSLERDLRHRLAAAATAFGLGWPSGNAKALIGSLALEGIEADVQPGAGAPSSDKTSSSQPPGKTGADITTEGPLLVLRERLADGTNVTFTASSAPIYRTVWRLVAVEAAVASGTLAIAALLLLRGTTTALRPLTHVAETAKRIADGDASERLRPSRDDTELGGMAAAFDQMVDALEGAAATAKSAEIGMRRFLADASHELRTPVAALQASAETLLREQPPRPERDQIEARLARDAAHLGRLVDDLLGLARLEADERPPHAVVDLASLVRSAADEGRRQAPDTSISVDAMEITRVRGDADGLTRLLRNLLDNATEAAGPEGSILVSVSREDGGVGLRVADDGPGVPTDDRERIFERFVRLGHDGRTGPGTGLGLAIARRIARQHGGDLTCDAVDRGASFTLHLPAEPG